MGRLKRRVHRQQYFHDSTIVASIGSSGSGLDSVETQALNRVFVYVFRLGGAPGSGSEIHRDFHA